MANKNNLTGLDYISDTLLANEDESNLILPKFVRRRYFFLTDTLLANEDESNLILPKFVRRRYFFLTDTLLANEDESNLILQSLFVVVTFFSPHFLALSQYVCLLLNCYRKFKRN